MSESSRRYAVLREATFDPKLASYHLLTGTILFVVLIVTIPIAIIYVLVGRYFINKYIERMSCTLTERSLEIRKGWISRVESTIPLEKITDLQMIQGPIMRYMGLHGFKVETAGQSAGPGGHLVS
ncbi:MAG: PH domain-containing protein, partial [Planctomycetota bacterium]